ncbi:DUF5681 domain-containing protein [Aestuariicoccus sp. MJ-SS9]|uniref:DUF5681 domain-containing protein n=1 Tax=Aestuariicoccus sp. MJ-SS9 TaxID=3079855 RepID=UPI002908808B|nr:DUF5681 domain-containing protein [Aestuariicoccus sp. MJ-SS9]MDU8912500.1 DUF5681 domain-containing protein [Aestuariicoccus sp. MJ-SS9]
MAEDRDTPDVVGYGNPPKHSRFKPGQSGNPGGRPKGSKSFKSVLQDELDREVSLSEQGVVSKVTKMEALAKRLVGDALSGDPRALAELLRQVNLHLPAAEAKDSRELPASDDDIRLLLKYADQAIVEKMGGVGNDETDKF